MMPDFKPRNSNFYKIAFIAAWFCLWFLPWQGLFPSPSNLYLVLLSDMFRLGIAMVGFILPGVFLYLLLEDARILADISGIIPIGFAFSVALIAVIGLAGRIVGLSFQTVKVLFVLAGAIAFIRLGSILPNSPGNRRSWFFSSDQKTLIKEYLPLLLVIFFSLLLTFHDQLLFIDDLTYLAYLTNWQFSSQLGFNNIVHQSDILEFERFWLALYPMGQALIADLSGVPGVLLVTNYLELFLVPIAGIASYWFGRELTLSRKASILSVLIQVSLFSWMIGEEWPVGKWFYESMGEDKVSAVFHLAPVFFVFILRYLNQPIKRNLLLITVSGLALTLTHPVILFFSCAIALGIALLSWWSRKAERKTVVVLVGVVVFMLPYLVIKLYDLSSQIGFAVDTNSVGASFQIERYTNIVSDIFYGLNPGVLLFFDIPPESDFYEQYQFLRLLPVTVALLAGVLALVRLKRGPLYWYIFSCVLWITIATIPYTGWILGFFVDARLISRVAWFMPLGLGSVLILKYFDEKMERISAFGIMRKSGSFAIVRGYFFWFLLSLVFISPLVVFRTLYLAPKYFGLLDHNRQLAEIGRYIDSNTTDPITTIALDYEDTQLLPGVSAHVSLISFREEMDYNGFNNSMPIEEIHHRINASNLIRSLDPQIPIQTRCRFLKQFEVRYVVAPTKDAGKYEDIVSNCGPVEIVFSTKDLVVIEFR